MTEPDHKQSPASSELHSSNVLEKGKDGNDVEIAQNQRDEVHQSPRHVHGFKWGLAVVAVVSSILLYATDNTIVCL